MKKVIFIFLISVSPLLARSAVSTDTLFRKKNIGLVLSNPGIGSKFHALGEFSLDANGINFAVYEKKDIDKIKIYRYNHLIKDVVIPYTSIVKIRRGFFKLIIASKLEVRLTTGERFRFDMLHDKRKCIEIVQRKINLN